jgi:quercetin dioxygenase-like cupin family protein
VRIRDLGRAIFDIRRRRRPRAMSAAEKVTPNLHAMADYPALAMLANARNRLDGALEAVTPLITKALAGFPGEQVLMYTVDFPPGFSSPIHRHNAQVSVYVLEGSVVMQVRGGKELILRPGQSFYEDPNDIHVVSRNASSTKLAKIPCVPD